MFKADWSLPEPTQDKYSDDLLSNATAFGDTAVVTIARSGGEGFDLPRDVNQEMADNPYFSYTNNSEEYTDFEDGQVSADFLDVLGAIDFGTTFKE